MFPVQASSLRIKGYVIINDRPCKIVQMQTSKPGKTGHAKCRIVGIDLFDNSKHEFVKATTKDIFVPTVERKAYQLVDMDDGYLSLLDSNGIMKNDIRIPSDEHIASQIREAVENNRDITICTLLAMGEEQVISAR